METGFSYGCIANEYILGKMSNTDIRILKTAFVKPAQPFKRLLEWLRSYNKSAIDKVQIYGVAYDDHSDMAPYVLDFLKKNDLSFYNTVGGEYRRVCMQAIKMDREHLVSAILREWSVDVPLDSIQHWRLISRQVYTHLLENRCTYGSVNSYTVETAIGFAKRIAQNFHRPSIHDEQYSSFLGHTLQKIGFPQYERNRSITLNYYYKDSIWAANTIDIVQHLPPGQTAVIWAHNQHIGRIVTRRTHRLGAYLGEQFGEKYQALGYYFGSGSFMSSDAESGQVKVFSANHLSVGSLEHIFSAALPVNAKGVLLKSDIATLPYLFSSSILSRTGSRLASVSQPTNYIRSNPFRDFDVLVYFKETTPEKRFNGRFAP